MYNSRHAILQHCMKLRYLSSFIVKMSKSTLYIYVHKINDLYFPENKKKG